MLCRFQKEASRLGLKISLYKLFMLSHAEVDLNPSFLHDKGTDFIR